MATRHLFSGRELVALRGFGDPSRQDLIRFFTLSATDLDFVAGRRGDSNRLGTAVQLCTLRWLGFVPDDVSVAPPSIVERLADQIGIPATAIVDYGSRSQTRTEQLVEVLAFEGVGERGAVGVESDRRVLVRSSVGTRLAEAVVQRGV